MSVYGILSKKKVFSMQGWVMVICHEDTEFNRMTYNDDNVC